MQVLIAEDDAVLRRLLQNYLEKDGYSIVSAPNGAEAGKLFDEGDYSLVLTDWMMPVVDGPELIRHIRSSDRADFVYVIMLTSRSDREDIREGMEAGADDFVTKPFDQDELRVRLRSGVRYIRLKQSLAESEGALKRAQRDAEASREREGLLSQLSQGLNTLRRNSLASLQLLETYREGRDHLARVAPSLSDEAARIEEEIDYASLRQDLPRQFAEAAILLERALGRRP